MNFAHAVISSLLISPWIGCSALEEDGSRTKNYNETLPYNYSHCHECRSTGIEINYEGTAPNGGGKVTSANVLVENYKDRYSCGLNWNPSSQKITVYHLGDSAQDGTSSIANIELGYAATKDNFVRLLNEFFDNCFKTKIPAKFPGNFNIISNIRPFEPYIPACSGCLFENGVIFESGPVGKMETEYASVTASRKEYSCEIRYLSQDKTVNVWTILKSLPGKKTDYRDLASNAPMGTEASLTVFQAMAGYYLDKCLAENAPKAF